MDNDESDAELDEGLMSSYKPSFILIALDAHPSMFDHPPTEEMSYFRVVLSACIEIAESLILTQNIRSWSPFGIALATDDDKSTLINLESNLIDTIKLLRAQLQLSDKDLIDLYQRKGGGFDLGSFFLSCKKKFKAVKSLYYKRTIIYITNDEDPVCGDPTKRFTALNEAKNFEASEINFNLVTMKDNFNYNKFYNELLSVLNPIPPIDEFVQDQDGLVEKLSTSIIVRYFRTKTHFFPFKGDKTRFLKIIEKKFIREPKVYDNTFVNDDGKPVKKINKHEEEQPKTFCLKYQSEKIRFDIQENFEIRHNNLEVGLTLIQVSDRVTKVGYVIGDSSLIEANPDEDLDYFTSFWQYCVDKQKVLICARKFRSQDKIRFVELIPQFGNNCRLFLVKKIPYCPEIFPIPTSLAKNLQDEEEELSPNPRKLELIAQLVNRLTYDYNPRMFRDPEFARKKAFIKSKLLNEPMEEIEDPTLSTVGIDRNISDFAMDVVAQFKLVDEDAGKKKRKSKASISTAKKNKIE